MAQGEGPGERGGAPLITSIPAFWLAGGGILATELHRRYGILGKTGVEPRDVAGLPGSGIEGGAARADVNELFKSSRQIAEEHQKAAEAVSKTAAAANNATPALNNIPMAANAAAGSLNTLASKISSFQMPSVQPPIPLAPVVPHQHGGITVRPHVGLIGEAGPEAIIPLKKGGGGFGHTINISAPVTINGAGAEGGNLTAILTEHARTIAREVQRVLEIQFEQNAIV